MDVFETINNHRTIREYKPDPIPEELLTKLLGAGIRASSAGNMQTYSIIVTRDETLRKQLYYAHSQQNMVLDAPILITFCADFNRMRKWLRINNAPDNFDNFMSFMIATIDAAIVAQNVALAAEAEGLGICYLGTTLSYCDQVSDILHLPSNVVPITGFTLGYADENPERRDRLPLDGLVHNETYQDYSDDRIREIYHDRNTAGWERYMSFPRLRDRIKESGVENLAQIYTVLKYTRESHQEFSENLLGFLKTHEFMN